MMYELRARTALANGTPTQSMSVANRCQTLRNVSPSLGVHGGVGNFRDEEHPFPTDSASDDARSTKPIPNPTGCTPPIDAKATLRGFPGGNIWMIMLTAEGRQKDAVIPENARSTMISTRSVWRSGTGRSPV